MAKLVVSDTNIFIDLISMGLLGDFFLLPFDISTVDFVIRKLKKTGQNEAVVEFQKRNRLTVFEFSSVEIDEIIKLKYSSGGPLSFQDCSVWYCAKQHSAVLLTGDKALSLKARADAIEVHGLLYIIEQLVDNNVIPPLLAAHKLEWLKNANKRLPMETVERLINKLRCLTTKTQIDM